MFCSKCGTTIDSKFCSNCGQANLDNNPEVECIGSFRPLYTASTRAPSVGLLILAEVCTARAKATTQDQATAKEVLPYSKFSVDLRGKT